MDACLYPVIRMAVAAALLLGAEAWAADAPALALERADGAWRFGNQRLRIRIDGASGAWTALDWKGRAVARDTAGVQYFDIRTAGGWLTGSGSAPRLESVQRIGEREIAARVAVGAWKAEFHYILYPESGRVQRWVRLLWNGTPGKREKLRGFWLRTPQMHLEPGGYALFPAHWPPLRRTVETFVNGRKTSASRSPGALVVQIAPDLSAVWLSNELTPRSDRPSVSTTEGEHGALRVGQGFQCEGWVRPGHPQDVGDAWLRLLSCDGETALNGMHDFLRDLKHVPPPDRPPWFKGAVLYSFHPGGTIGSQFQDLGGFRAASDLLDAVRALGCNAVWILPIEDSGVYHPRDYYKLQKRLGSVEEYRALVRKARRLRMHVLRDIVPHGGTNTCPRAKAHPEWLLRTEDDQTLPYWCFDFNWPTWIRYMARVALDYMKQADIDGFRVDAVYGSKISNWNPDIPYARASFARLQGGLHMLAAIRRSVKTVKPRDGGVLAEVGSSAHGTVSDAVYDFQLCYSVLHDLRRRPVTQVVPELQRWLYEQERSEAPDLIRLRHIESHDSLRSLLWYGLRPQRALVAFISWIHGMPLVYHEMENGSSAVFRRIFDIRSALPELRGGAMDPLAATAPPGVFTCLRSVPPDRASVVLINLNPGPVGGRVRVAAERLPPGLSKGSVHVLDAWNDRLLPVADSAPNDRGIDLPLDLPAFGFTVYVLRGTVPPRLPPAPDRWAVAARPAGGGTSGAVADSRWVPLNAGKGARLYIDRVTGLPARYDVGGHPVLGMADLVLDPVACPAAESACELRTAPGVVRARRRFGERTLEITYRATPAGTDGIDMILTWTGGDLPGYAAFYWPVVDANRWYASCAEGVFEDRYRVRHRTTDGVIGSIYWRPQGTATVWDSLLHPLGVTPDAARLGTIAGEPGRIVSFTFPETRLFPARVRWLDRVGNDERLGLLINWRGPDADDLLPGGVREFRVRLGPDRGPTSVQLAPAARGRRWTRDAGAAAPDTPHRAGRIRVLPAVGGYVVIAPHYRLRLGRSGCLTSLHWKDGDRVPASVFDGDLYSDAGFSRKNTFYGACNDVEAAARVEEDGNGNVLLRFFGQLRGFHRFDKMPAPVWYRIEYLLHADAPGFRMTCAVRPQTPPFGKRAFLAWRVRTRDAGSIEYRRAGKKIAGGSPGDGSKRVLQTRDLPGTPVPDEIRLSDRNGRPLMCLTDFHAGGARAIPNVFMHGANLFVAWYDGRPDAPGAGRWSWFSAMVTPRSHACAPFGRDAHPPAGAEKEAGAGVRMPGFEEMLVRRPRFLRSGHVLPIVGVRTPWRPPPTGGRIVTDIVHGGHAAAFVENLTGGYLLWSQDLDLRALPAGSHWRLSAWVRGENIVHGEPAWKTGTVRWTFFVKGKARFVSSAGLLGTFDWKRVAVDAVIPEGTERIVIQIGLNGSRGRMWIDDVRIDPVP